MKCTFARLVIGLLLAFGGVLSLEAAAPLAVKGMTEALVPTREPTAGEQAAMSAAKDLFLARTDTQDMGAWESFLSAHPDSPYNLAILTNLGSSYYRSGRFSKCLRAYAAAWEAGKDLRNHPAEPLAGHAGGELAMMYARLGRYENLEALLKEVEGREFRGPGSNLFENARAGFELMKSVPETSFRCGPMALSRILAFQGKDFLPDPIRNSVSTRQGISLDKVKAIAGQVGLENYQVARRAPGAAILLPAVVHWKEGHYAALVKEQDGKYLVEDPTFAFNVAIWITPQTLDEESSGYFLVNTPALPVGWTAVDEAEAATVWGKGQTGSGDPNRTGPNDRKSGGPSSSSSSGSGDGGPCGMATWSVHSMLVSLNIMDRPMGYTPPVGPPVSVLLTYNSMENEFIATPVHTSFGPKWLFNGIAWLSDVGGTVQVNGGYGGTETYYETGTPGEFSRNLSSYSTLKRTSVTPTYERAWPDGTKEIYGAVGPNGLVYRTQLVDPFGNAVTYQYNNTGSAITLAKIVDALGQETVFEYANGGTAPMKITDPFGRFTSFQYDSSGRLTHITDVVGITSQFSYKSTGNFIEKLTTPYGDTAFDTGFKSTTRWLEATYPNGDRERMEFRHNAEGIPDNLGTAPANMLVSPNYNNYRNALHWDRKAMKDAPGDVSQAHLTHFLHTQNVSQTSGLVESEKKALEGRIYYNYVDQGSANVQSAQERMSKVGRLLDDGTTELSQFEYNEAGNPTTFIDPEGRTTFLIYAPNLRDVLEVRQKVGTLPGGQDVTETIMTATYNAAGQPLTITNAGGQTVTMTYNTRGQPLTRVLPNGDTTTYTYDANGYITTMDGPLAGVVDQMTLAHDSKGRLASVTDALGLTMTLEYDHLNRMTKRTYADASYEQWTYDALSLRTYRARDGRVLTYEHNGLAQITRITDHLNRATVLDWCRCGDLKMIIDPAGRMTRFFHDVQGRITGKAYADGTSTQVLYQPMSGRVASTVDEVGRTKTFTYDRSGSLLGLAYGGTGPALPAVSFTWDAAYARLAGFTDGSGSTALTYHPYQSGQNAPGRLASTNGPLPNDTVTFAYDALGRVTARGVNGVGESFTLDAAGRPSAVTNALGTTNYTWDSGSTRPLTMTLPGGQQMLVDYFTVPGLKLLKDITHKAVGGTEISKFGYTYNAGLSVEGVTRSLDGGAGLADTASYDSAHRLTGYTKALAGGGTQTFAYTYDTADNRVSETIGGTSTTADVNLLNQVTQLTPAPAAARTHTWDGAGRLGAVESGTHRSEFYYDAFGRRVRIVEKENGGTVADRRFIWVGGELAEERDASGTLVKQFFAQGFATATGTFFYTRDSLGSIREVTDGTGAVRARYDYDPYGRRVKLSGDVDADMGYGSLFYHAPSQLCLAFARAYDPAQGRWISRDPAGETFGFNLYAYVNNDPLSFTDPSGLEPDYLGGAASLVQAAGCVGGIVVTVGVIAAAPVAGPGVLLFGAGLVLYNGMGAAFNLTQAIAKFNGMDPIMGAGGSEFQFNPVTEGAHFIGLGGDCHPFMEVAVQGAGVGFDILLGNKLSGVANVPHLAGAAAAASEAFGHMGNTANMAGPLGAAGGTAAGSIPTGPVPLSPYPSPPSYPNSAAVPGRPAMR